mmetsp:Transcript_39120/g.102561  ORF Transcript_39120/g.102561 Transcript_39120/m.102561 type:complete len:235 (-) Transcript_39120:22-726(-)
MTRHPPNAVVSRALQGRRTRILLESAGPGSLHAWSTAGRLGVPDRNRLKALTVAKHPLNSVLHRSYKRILLESAGPGYTLKARSKARRLGVPECARGWCDSPRPRVGRPKRRQSTRSRRRAERHRLLAGILPPQRVCGLAHRARRALHTGSCARLRCGSAEHLRLGREHDGRRIEVGACSAPLLRDCRSRANHGAVRSRRRWMPIKQPGSKAGCRPPPQAGCAGHWCVGCGQLA